jgi:DNA excision repair protein ERCC-2
VTVRYDDAERTIRLSVHDVVDLGVEGHLFAELASTRATRLALGRRTHVDWQGERAEQDGEFRAELALRAQVGIEDWTVVVHGRVDGKSDEGERAVLEELKSTVLGADALFVTRHDDWAAYVEQLELYLWMWGRTHGSPCVGRLVLVSLVDGARHVLGVPADDARVEARLLVRLERLVRLRRRRLAWLDRRRLVDLPLPYAAWRDGQQTVADEVGAGLARGEAVLAEAPTGLGKTGAVLHAALRHALATGKQVFWATAKTTHREAVIAVIEALRARGAPIRWTVIASKASACLNPVVRCRPDACAHAASYFDKLHDQDLLPSLHDEEAAPPARIRGVAQQAVVCPYQLALDVGEDADVVIGDANYVFDPWSRLLRYFGERRARDFVVVVDEAHQLVDRARDYGSPRVDARDARAAIASLSAEEDPAFEPFVGLAGEVLALVVDAGLQVTGPGRDDVAVAELSAAPWRDLEARIDEVALDWARLRTTRPMEVDPWVELARKVLRFTARLQDHGEETVHLVGTRPGDEFVSLLCLDPSVWLGDRIAALGGFVGTSATLSPPACYRDLLGLDPHALRVVRVGSPFPPEHRKIVIAPQVSTAWRHRVADADATAALVAGCVEAVPGNVAVYFPSFHMLRDIAGRWTLADREVLVQQRDMSEEERDRWLARLRAGGPPVVLAAVLGGIFAEGIDLPGGALLGVVIVGPALPPVGLERDLLTAWYEERYGEGFLYASLVPGMSRVVQAAGRLVRGPDDRGVIVLVDRRFLRREIRGLLPPDWEPVVAGDPAAAVRDGPWRA